MYYISKGLPEKEGITPQLRVMSGGQIYTLFGLAWRLTANSMRWHRPIMPMP